MRVLHTLTAGSVMALLAIISLPVRSAVGREQTPSRDEERSGSEADPADWGSALGDLGDEMEALLEVRRDPPASRAMLSLRGVGPAHLWRIGPYQSIQVNVDGSENNILGDAANEPSM
ncbi:MAG TPA: hypothetical protein VGR38_07470, partial [Candidatus Polarisedimenticolia bacterium]|nr:hypothetical protein [Candidatus Polarisedimenticolia bacterium]